MSTRIFLTVLAFASSAISVISAQDNDFSSKFQAFGIVPDVISSTPNKSLEIRYPSGFEVNYGNELVPVDAKDQPYVTWNANSEDFYTLIFVDPDVPSRQNNEFSEIKSWLVVNIPGNNLADGDTIVEYIGAGPYKDTGLHRYVFVVLKQPRKLDFSAELITTKIQQEGRRNFSIRKFAEKYSLELFAGNFFQAQFDDYVPILIAQLHPELA